MDDEYEIFGAVNNNIIKSWFDNFAKGKFAIRCLKNGNIKISGDVVIKGFDGEEIPSIIHIDDVNGSFKIEKCPNLKHINNLFIEYAEVKGDFSIGNCSKLTSLVGGPYTVKGNVYITSNTSLKSLDGMPSFVYDGIYVMKNGKKFTENIIKSYVTVPSFIACSEENEEDMITEAMNEPHLLRLAKQLKNSTINGMRYTFNDIFGRKFSKHDSDDDLTKKVLNIDVAFDQIDSSNVTQYRHASDPKTLTAIRNVISKAGVRGLILFTDYSGEYMFAITSSKKYRILSDEYAYGNLKAKQEWIEIPYTSIMDRCDGPWGVVIITWDAEDVGTYYLTKKRTGRKISRDGMIVNTPEQNEQFARENRDRYKRLAAQMRAQKDEDYIEIDEQVEKIIMDVLAISKDAKRNSEKYRVYDIHELLEKTYGVQHYVGRSSIYKNGFAGEDGLLNLYEQFTTAYMDLSQNGGSSYHQKHYDRVKAELRDAIKNMQEKINDLKK